MRIVVTGAHGFIGTNLTVALRERDGMEVVPVTRETTQAELETHLARADAVIHLAGVNRPPDVSDYVRGNVDFTQELIGLMETRGRALPVAYASSIQAVRDNPYGVSKRRAEELLAGYASRTGAGVAIYRWPNVFGKWCRPNYNSVVATFCHNIARDLPIRIEEPEKRLFLLYIDDVVRDLVSFLQAPPKGVVFPVSDPVYETTVGDLAAMIRGFHEMRPALAIDRVGEGLRRALYATYVSYLPPTAFSYGVPGHEDPRGLFVEFLKTRDSGQVSFFTARPGVTRGGHYHHTKTEKFLVVQGSARFRFQHVQTGEVHVLDVSANSPTVVESIPGWTHDVTNTGEEDLLVLLWANEVFDPARPDTVVRKLTF